MQWPCLILIALTYFSLKHLTTSPVYFGTNVEASISETFKNSSDRIRVPSYSQDSLEYTTRMSQGDHELEPFPKPSLLIILSSFLIDYGAPVGVNTAVSTNSGINWSSCTQTDHDAHQPPSPKTLQTPVALEAKEPPALP